MVLTRISLPFLRLYRAYQQLKKGKGDLDHFWKNTRSEISALGALDGPMQRRIFHYLFANSLTTQWFANLLKHTPSAEEKYTGYLIAIATPIADYLVDHEKMTVEAIEQMIHQNSGHPWQTLTSQLFERVLKVHPSPDMARQLIHLTLHAQEDSLKQRDQQLSPGQLKDITWAKGGYALLLYRSALRIPISHGEWDAVYQLGGLMQLHNDIFDLYRDVQEGIVTIPSQTGSVDQLIHLFEDEIEKTFRLFDTLPINRYRKHKFYLLLSLAIQTGHLCLCQYRNLEMKYQGFRPGQLSRKELICDMDNLGKISKTILATVDKKYW